MQQSQPVLPTVVGTAFRLASSLQKYSRPAFTLIDHRSEWTRGQYCLIFQIPKSQ
jgi:hypothetical protein